MFPPVPDVNASLVAGIYKLSRNGDATPFADGLHAVLGIAFDAAHRLYVLQSPIFVPGTGSLVRRTATGEWETLLSGLTFPAGLTRGPDGALYLSECAYHCQPGQGRVLRVAINSPLDASPFIAAPSRRAVAYRVRRGDRKSPLDYRQEPAYAVVGNQGELIS
jgi:hypothetical protein